MNSDKKIELFIKSHAMTTKIKEAIVKKALGSQRKIYGIAEIFKHIQAGG